MEASEGFLENAVLVVAMESWAECENGVPGLLANRVVAEPAESTEVDESPRECEKKLLSEDWKALIGVVIPLGESNAPPNDPPPPPKAPKAERPNGVGADIPPSSSKSIEAP